MKKSHFLSIILLVSSHFVLSAQSKSYLGIGTSFNVHHSTVFTNNDAGLQPENFNFNSYGFNLFLNLNSDKRFQFRANARTTARKIRFASENPTAFGDLMITTLEHDYISVDMDLMGLYAISLNENNKLLPALGVLASYNFYNGYSFPNIDNSQLSTQNAFEGLPVNTNRPAVAYFGLSTGLFYQTKIKGRAIAFFGMYYFSLPDKFETTFEYENRNSLTYKGTYHNVSLGVAIPIFLQKNKN